MLLAKILQPQRLLMLYQQPQRQGSDNRQYQIRDWSIIIIIMVAAGIKRNGRKCIRSSKNFQCHVWSRLRPETQQTRCNVQVVKWVDETTKEAVEIILAWCKRANSTRPKSTKAHCRGTRYATGNRMTGTSRASNRVGIASMTSSWRFGMCMDIAT
jgi:hypothetical protein